MSRTWRSRLTRSFFGLTPEYIESVYEQFFFLKYSGGWSFAESYNLPIGLRSWFVERLIKQLKMEKEAIENSQASKSGSGRAGRQELTAQNQPKMPSSLMQSS